MSSAAYAIANEYGKHPTRPLDVAAAMGITPTSGRFKMLTGASIAYGFTEGGAQADEISLTELGMRVVAPTEEGDDDVAKREALLRPRVVREFLEKYDGSKLPRETIAKKRPGADGRGSQCHTAHSYAHHRERQRARAAH